MNKVSKETAYINKKNRKHVDVDLETTGFFILREIIDIDDVVIAWIELYLYHIKKLKTKIKKYDVIDTEKRSAHHSYRIVLTPESETPDLPDELSISLYRFKKFCRTRSLMDTYITFSSYLMIPYTRIDERKKKYREYIEKNKLNL